MHDFADWLARRLGGPVVDQTGLTDRYDFELNIPRSDPDPGGGSKGNSDADHLDAGGWPLAARDVGLRLKSTKTNLNFLVVDHVERPSLN